MSLFQETKNIEYFMKTLCYSSFFNNVSHPFLFIFCRTLGITSKIWVACNSPMAVCPVALLDLKVANSLFPFKIGKIFQTFLVR